MNFVSYWGCGKACGICRYMSYYSEQCEEMKNLTEIFPHAINCCMNSYCGLHTDFFVTPRL